MMSCYDEVMEKKLALAVRRCGSFPDVSRYADVQMRWHLLAEVKEQTFKHQHWSRAAQDGERLASQQAEDGTRQRRAKKTFQHTL